MGSILYILYSGTKLHEGCVFVRKVNSEYHVIHYNPTFDWNITKFGEFIDELNVKTEVYGYQDVDCNKDGACTFLAWVEMVYLLLGGTNPFNDIPPRVYSRLRRNFIRIVKKN